MDPRNGGSKGGGSKDGFEGWGAQPRKSGAKGGGPKGGGPKCGGRNFALFPVRPQNSFFSSLSGGLLVEFWWCFRYIFSDTGIFIDIWFLIFCEVKGRLINCKIVLVVLEGEKRQGWVSQRSMTQKRQQNKVKQKKENSAKKAATTTEKAQTTNRSSSSNTAAPNEQNKHFGRSKAGKRLAFKRLTT